MTDAAPLHRAATILLVRDAPRFEVLMVERHHQIDFASGALVFPGGKAALGDDPALWGARLHGAPAIAPPLAELMIAALREAFEESGLLLARRADAGPQGPLVRGDAFPQTLQRRAAISLGGSDFREAIAADDLALALDQLSVFAHWVTPDGMPKRFDTMFFIAAAPADQGALHDGHEAVDAVWLTPREALDAAAAGVRKIIFPTLMNLQRLACSQSVAEAVAAARVRPAVRVEPRIAPVNGVMTLTIPESAGYGAISVPFNDAI